MTLCITHQGKYMQITSKRQKMNKAGNMRAPIGNAQMREWGSHHPHTKVLTLMRNQETLKQDTIFYP